MKKVGFTLAEVLITLAIIGVVAALTLPALQTNILRQQIPTSLAKAINTIENANQLLKQQNDIRDIFRFCGNNYLECLTENNILGAHQITAPDNIRSYNREVISLNIQEAYATRDNIAFYGTASIQEDSTMKPTYSLSNMTIFTDINGPSKGPNILGLDIFQLIINGRGDVFPYGGRALTAAKNSQNNENSEGNENNEDTAPGKTWEATCNSNAVGSTENLHSGDTCAGSIVDNGYRVIYPLGG